MEILDFVNDREVGSMDNIFRWGMERTIKDENIAGHSWWVTLFSYLITVEFCKLPVNEKNAIMLAVFIKSLTHDMDEMFTDDISHDVKYNDFNGEHLKEQISTYASHKFNKKFANMPDLLEAVKHEAESEIDEVIFAIVKMGDWFACIKYVVAEISIGNKGMDEKLVKCVGKLRAHIQHTLNILKTDEIITGFDEWFLKKLYEDVNHYYETYWKHGRYSN